MLTGLQTLAGLGRARAARVKSRGTTDAPPPKDNSNSDEVLMAEYLGKLVLLLNKYQSMAVPADVAAGDERGLMLTFLKTYKLDHVATASGNFSHEAYVATRPIVAFSDELNALTKPYLDTLSRLGAKREQERKKAKIKKAPDEDIASDLLRKLVLGGASLGSGRPQGEKYYYSWMLYQSLYQAAQKRAAEAAQTAVDYVKDAGGWFSKKLQRFKRATSEAVVPPTPTTVPAPNIPGVTAAPPFQQTQYVSPTDFAALQAQQDAAHRARVARQTETFYRHAAEHPFTGGGWDGTVATAPAPVTSPVPPESPGVRFTRPPAPQEVDWTKVAGLGGPISKTETNWLVWLAVAGLVMWLWKESGNETET